MVETKMKPLLELPVLAVARADEVVKETIISGMLMFARQNERRRHTSLLRNLDQTKKGGRSLRPRRSSEVVPTRPKPMLMLMLA